MTVTHPWPWPPAHQPDRSALAVHNDVTTDLSPHDLWPVLLAAANWPTWYANARHVVLPPGQRHLALGTTFTWTTFHLRIESTVRECVPESRLAWDGRALGAAGYHRWALHPTAGGGTHLVTEEVQHGPAARLAAPAMRRALQRRHQIWLEGLVRHTRRNLA
ncbi:SRPBCC domain-containing protein [Streptomyces sp. NPDC004082]|uniref:SRPBCC domain-containing protein n=1 Tax=unclassified Streptomyces TaxID=2593676 RepID=UPI0033A37ED9